jgi:hypothetical protein
MQKPGILLKLGLSEVFGNHPVVGLEHIECFGTRDDLVTGAKGNKGLGGAGNDGADGVKADIFEVQ